MAVHVFIWTKQTRVASWVRVEIQRCADILNFPLWAKRIRLQSAQPYCSAFFTVCRRCYNLHVCVCVYRWRHQVVATGLLQRVTRKMMMQMPSNSFLGHPGLQSNYQSMMIGAESQRLLPTWNYPPPPPPPPSTHTAASAGSTSVFNCLPVDRPSSNDEKSIQGQTQHQQLASSSSSSSIPFTAGHGC